MLILEVTSGHYIVITTYIRIKYITHMGDIKHTIQEFLKEQTIYLMGAVDNIIIIIHYRNN